MANLLALLQGLVGQPTGDADLEGVTVMPRKKPAPMPIPEPVRSPVQNPFTDDYIAAAQAMAQSQGKLPKIGGGLRGLLGAIGDGIFLGGGMKEQYTPRIEQQRMGQALLGYDQDPQAAIARLAQTGAVDSIDTAKTLLQGLQTSEDKAAQREMQGAYYNELTKGRADTALQRAATGILPSLFRGVQDSADYGAAFSRATALARRIAGPDADATTAFGLPDPADWSPEDTAMYGTTGGQLLGADVNRERIKQSDVNNQRTTSTSAANNIRTTSTSAANNQRTTATSAANNQRSVAQRDRATAGKAKPGAKASTAKGSKALPAGATDAYSKGTPAQRAQARKTWAAQGFDTSKLK